MEYSQADITARISERQMRLWNALHSAEHARRVKEHTRVSPYRFATVSRDAGSLGDEIAKELANRLGWHLFDREIVNSIARNQHVREEMVNQLDEKSQGILQEAILRLLRMPENASFGSEEYHISLIRTFAMIASQGGAILLGRGANFALRWSEAGLHIRITGSAEARLRRLNEQWRLPADKARKRLEEIDTQKRNFIRRHYGKDYNDIGYYDIVLNTDRLSVSQAVDLILSILAPKKSLRMAS